MNTYLLIYDNWYEIKQVEKSRYLYFDDDVKTIVLLTEEMIKEISLLKESDK
jgi:hypothetical protein